MATTIRIKKSGQTGNIPTSGDLEFGELAINYADGIIYYKDASNNIQLISGVKGNTFETINANGTLLIADSNTDILTLTPGDGISITGNAITDTVTINVQFNDTVSSNSIITAATANSVKTAYDTATAAANTVMVSLDSGSTLSSKKLNFVNTANATIVVTDNGDGNANIAIETFAVGGSSSIIKSDKFTANGVQNVFTITNTSTTDKTFVFLDGVSQQPGVDYTVFNKAVTFNVAPANNTIVEVRAITDIALVYYANVSVENTTLELAESTQIFKTNGFSTPLDSISRLYLLRGTTTSNTESELFLNTGARVPVNANSTIFYTADIVARRTDATGESAGFTIKGVVDNFSNTVADVGDLYEVVVAEDDSGLSVDARADDTNNSINIYVTGSSGKTIRWTALVKTVEVAE